MVCWEIKFENKSIQMLTTYCCFILFKSNENPNFPQWKIVVFENFHKIGYFYIAESVSRISLHMVYANICFLI